MLNNTRIIDQIKYIHLITMDTDKLIMRTILHDKILFLDEECENWEIK